MCVSDGVKLVHGYLVQMLASSSLAEIQALAAKQSQVFKKLKLIIVASDFGVLCAGNVKLGFCLHEDELRPALKTFKDIRADFLLIQSVHKTLFEAISSSALLDRTSDYLATIAAATQKAQDSIEIMFVFKVACLEAVGAFLDKFNVRDEASTEITKKMALFRTSVAAVVSLFCSRDPSDKLAEELAPLVAQVMGLTHEMLQLAAAASDKGIEATVRYGEAVAACFSRVMLCPDLLKFASAVDHGKRMLNKDVTALLDNGFNTVLKAASFLHAAGFNQVKLVAELSDTEYLRFGEYVSRMHKQVSRGQTVYVV